MYSNGFKALLTATALAAGAAHATTTQLDLSPIANTSYGIGAPVGNVAGNTGTAAAALNFTLLDPGTTNNVWVGGSTGQSADLVTDIYGASSVDTLINTLYGQSGTTALTVEFKGSAGAVQTFTLVGNSDVRDYNNWVWTDSINGTTTQEWWTNNLNPTPDDQSHRLDAQTFALSAAFATQTLTDIIFTAGEAGVNFSQPMLTAVDVVTGAVTEVPEPASAGLMLLGVASLVAFARRG